MLSRRQIILFLKRLKYYFLLSVDYYRHSIIFTKLVKNNYPLFMLRVGLFLWVNIQREAIRYAVENQEYAVLEHFCSV